MKTTVEALAAWAFMVTFAVGFAQPIITTQPQDQIVVAGVTATFSTWATGEPPLRFQWRRYTNTTVFGEVPAATNETLMVTPSQPTSQRFAVVVSNPEGAVTSVLARLTVLVPPAISVQPPGQIVNPGATAGFSVVATGTTPLSYQWRFNQSNLAGKTSATLTVVNAQTTNAGSYSVVVTNVAGSVTSQPAFLRLPAPHGFGEITVPEGGTASLGLIGTAAPVFQHYYDLFPLEVSENLREWAPLATLFHTNRSASRITFLDAAAATQPRRFYRTPTNHFVTPIPPPGGPYSVGFFSRLVTDPSRTHRYTNGNSSFMLSIWHPAQPAAGGWPGPYADSKIGALGPAYCIPARYAGFHGHALTGVPWATNEERYPLVIYSHGYRGLRTDNTRKVETLASYGFVVIALDNIDCYATVFPDGRLLRGTNAGTLGTDAATFFIATNRLEDVRFLLEVIEQWNLADPIMQGRLDLGHVGIFGHSFGGGTSMAACAQEPRLKAGLSLDGGWPFTPYSAGDCPFLIFNGGDIDAFMQLSRNSFRAMFDRMVRDAYWVPLKDSTHCDFNETPWFDAPPSPMLTRRALVQDRYLVSFFRKHLRNEDDHLLDGPSVEYPEVDGFLRK